MSQRIDVHQAITDRIIQAIEQGAGEFKLPWHRPAGSITRPTNIQSKKAYRGINVVTLWVEAQLKGYATPVWGTYKQMSEAGCQVRKGEKAVERLPTWARADFKWLQLFPRRGDGSHHAVRTRSRASRAVSPDLGFRLTPGLPEGEIFIRTLLDFDL